MRIKNNISGSWYFFLVMTLTYILLLFFDPGTFYSAISFFYKIFLRIVPIFFLIFILMSLTNYFVTPKKIMRHLNEKGAKKWFFMIFGGILSSGPIYMWYPLLADLKKKGLKEGLIACFLYNRAIKLPLLPLAIVYFSWKFVLTLTLVMIFASVVQGILLNKFEEVKK